jgi:DnaJ-class molecular chaperone
MGIDIASIFSFFAENKNSDFAQHMNMQMNKPVPIIKTIDITLEQAYAGCMIPVEIDRIFVENNIKSQERETLYIPVPKGIDNNELLIFRNIGNRAETGVSGDVKIFIKVLDHVTFKRVGLDLIYNKQITLKESLCGVSFNIPHLSGKNYNINNTAGSSIIAPSFEKKIMGLGLSRDEHAGSLIIKFDIIFPTKLPIEIVHKLAELL